MNSIGLGGGRELLTHTMGLPGPHVNPLPTAGRLFKRPVPYANVTRRPDYGVRVGDSHFVEVVGIA